jgi:general secretion pathway protein D
MWKIIVITSMVFVLSACTEIEPKPFEPSSGHIDTQEQPVGEIPELVAQAPILPEPAAPVDLEKYTVVVNEVPVKELLFALARDAQINVDIDPVIDGIVTINAVEQTLPQILERIARQVDLRYEFEGDNLIIMKDEPYLRTYVIDYVNMSRDTSISNTVATQIAGTSGGGESGSAGGGNNSTTGVTSVSVHHFWETLVLNISALLGEEATGASAGAIPITVSVIPNPEAGILTVRATEEQHKYIQSFIDDTLASVKRQVLIQATIAEVRLSDQYQAGIDWSFINQAGKAGIDIVSTTFTGFPVGTLSSFIIDYVDPNPDREEILRATVRLLDEFGDTTILSSPQIMVLNNQTALLKVVENFVYFDIDVEPGVVSLAGVTDPAIETNAQTIPVGIVMSVTPQIASNDVITLNVRPTISEVTEFVNDPNPELITPTVTLTNPVPQIAVREMESMLRLTNGQIGILGGMMQDKTTDNDRGLPGVSKQPGLGIPFKTTTKEYFKTEIVIFLRPFIIRNPSLDDDLQYYKTFLNPQRHQRDLSGQGDGAL